MNPGLIWTNVVNYCLEIGLLIGLAAFIPTVLRLTAPRVRLAFWHILLVACLILPLFGPKRREVITATVQAPAAISFPFTPVHAPARRSIPWTQVALGLLAAGAAARLLWLCAGLRRLRSYRRRSRMLHPPASWSVEADLRLSEDVASPVTFGFIHPVVLLPANFPEMNRATQDAILCHEILHVRRKDWLVMLFEELVRSVLWFHPAIWWLLGEIGLAREQAVDREVIELTQAREEYVDALLAIAGAKAHLDLAPAPLFLRKRHLKQRVVSILKEARMSKTRSISALAAGLGILAAACWLVTMTFPLAAAPQTVADDPGVTVDVGNAALMHRSPVTYPESARRARVEGTVMVEAMLDNGGNVVDARVLSGPNELRRAALQSVLQWHFASDTGGGTRQVRIAFQLPPAQSSPQTVTTAEVSSPATIRRAPIDQLSGKTLKQIRVLGLTDESKTRLLARLPVHEGDILSADSWERTTSVVRDYDEHLILGRQIDRENGVTFIISATGMTSAAFGAATASLAEVPPPANGAKRITIGGNVQSAKLTDQPKPVYPPLAKQARITGTVKLAVIIAVDGTVRDIRVISGHPLLIPAALEAVKQWTYSKTLLNGEPAEVSTQVDINFTLSDDPPQG
jgi:TonB family protein